MGMMGDAQTQGPLEAAQPFWRVSRGEDAGLTNEESAYLDRNVAHPGFTPFAGEPVGWMIDQAGADLFMFSSDYPHPEGTKDPVQRFESTMGAPDGETLDRFYRANFEALYRGHVPV